MRVILSILFVFLFTASRAQYNVTPVTLTTLSPTVNESSGLVNIGGTLWTHNDSGGLPSLFQISPQDGTIVRTVAILQASNVDWEDIAFDCTYVYIGDFGNNSGSRTDLKIYRITRTDLASLDAVPAEIIPFSYSDQTSWVPNPNQTDFDCEAFIAYQGNLWLFSKDWVDHKTRLYLLPSEPGTHVAQYQSTFDVEGLVTGAEMLPNDVLVLQSYTSMLSPFNWLFQQFPGQSFFDGLSTKLNWTGISQTEGVCFADTNGIYVSSEKIGFPFNTQATLYYLDISAYFINPPPNGIGQVKPQLVFYSDPLHIYIKSKNRELIPATIRIVNSLGMVLQTINEYFDSEIRIPVQFNKGLYIVNVHTRRWDYSGRIIIY